MMKNLKQKIVNHFKEFENDKMDTNFKQEKANNMIKQMKQNVLFLNAIQLIQLIQNILNQNKENMFIYLILIIVSQLWRQFMIKIKKSINFINFQLIVFLFLVYFSFYHIFQNEKYQRNYILLNLIIFMSIVQDKQLYFNSLQNFFFRCCQILFFYKYLNIVDPDVFIIIWICHIFIFYLYDYKKGNHIDKRFYVFEQDSIFSKNQDDFKLHFKLIFEINIKTDEFKIKLLNQSEKLIFNKESLIQYLKVMNPKFNQENIDFNMIDYIFDTKFINNQFYQNKEIYTKIQKANENNTNKYFLQIFKRKYNNLMQVRMAMTKVDFKDKILFHDILNQYKTEILETVKSEVYKPLDNSIFQLQDNFKEFKRSLAFNKNITEKYQEIVVLMNIIKFSIDSLFHFESNQKSQLKISIQKIQMTQLLAEIKSYFLYYSKRKRINIELNLDIKNSYIITDVQKLTWVIIALFENAIINSKQTIIFSIKQKEQNFPFIFSVFFIYLQMENDGAGILNEQLFRLKRPDLYQLNLDSVYKKKGQSLYSSLKICQKLGPNEEFQIQSDHQKGVKIQFQIYQNYNEAMNNNKLIKQFRDISKLNFLYQVQKKDDNQTRQLKSEQIKQFESFLQKQELYLKSLQWQRSNFKQNQNNIISLQQIVNIKIVCSVIINFKIKFLKIWVNYLILDINVISVFNFNQVYDLVNLYNQKKYLFNFSLIILSCNIDFDQSKKLQEKIKQLETDEKMEIIKIVKIKIVKFFQNDQNIQENNKNQLRNAFELKFMNRNQKTDKSKYETEEKETLQMKQFSFLDYSYHIPNTNQEYIEKIQKIIKTNLE